MTSGGPVFGLVARGNFSHPALLRISQHFSPRGNFSHPAPVTQRLNLIFKQIRNRLSIHNGKSEAMLLSTKPLIGPLQELRYEDNRIDFVNSTCCLGVEIDNKLSWSPHIDKLCKGYKKKLGALRRMPRLPPKVLEEIYFKTVVPGVT